MLQFGPPPGCDEGTRERAEPGGHAVDRPALVLDPVHNGPAALQSLHCGRCELDPGAAPGDGEDVGGFDAGRLDGHGVHSGSPLRRTVWTRGTPGR